LRRAVRITRSEYVDDAFSGEGARLYGGRWNLKGVPVVYAAGSEALAILELLVHLGRVRVLKSYSTITVSFEADLVERLDETMLPGDWRSYPAPARLNEIGTEWAEQERSVVLEVPSAVVPAETNFLLNPEHPEFRRLTLEKPRPCVFDSRLFEG